MNDTAFSNVSRSNDEPSNVRPSIAAFSIAAFSITAGEPWPLGAHWNGSGVNIAVFSAHATAIDLCLFDASGEEELARLRLPRRSDDVFHGFVQGIGPGQVYGLRAEGLWEPLAGHRFNPAKLLLDPNAREIVGNFSWTDLNRAGAPGQPDAPDPRDNTATALKARVVADQFDWSGDVVLRTPMAQTVIYEVHVKGFSKRHPGVPEALRGTFAGLAHPASTAHLKALGVTAVCLLPIHHHLDEERLVGVGLVNYWGYNTIGFFCPDPRLAAASQPGHWALNARDEFRAMVKALHATGIEVILDVVYNHTAECDADGPSLSWRGLDNASCYRLEAADKRVYENHAGCGNTLDLREPRMLQLVMDSLRFWVSEMHVDGFRFDLATVLARGEAGFDPRAAFFAAALQDPVLARVKMIAEPWDIGPGGYQVGAFPLGWSEWNDRFRDDLRGFWLQGKHARGVLAQRLCGSSDVFEASGRAPSTSINYVVSHDGFTLRDLVSYTGRHNLANGEGNRDGTSHNISCNGGIEGPTDDPAINAFRGRLQRVMLALTVLAQGTPMLCAGDELGHSQGGNNNPYCQDNETTWIDWATADADLIAFTTHLIALRHAHAPFADRWYSTAAEGQGLQWTGPNGQPLDAAAWNAAEARCLACHIGSARAPMLLLMNGSAQAAEFALPPGAWAALLDTTAARGTSDWHGSDSYLLPAQSIVLLTATAP